MVDALELAEVSKVYQVGDAEVVALNHVDLTVAHREVVTLLGPSGSGKTTLLSIAGGLLTPSTGRVVVGGNDITSFSARKLTRFRRRYVGFIFQGVNLVPFLTARENLLVVAELTRRDRRKAARRADALLEGLGLSHRVDNLPGQLSGGERQRVAIGRALMNEPTLVLVDEPTSALDSQMGEQVMELIVAEVKARDAAAVIVTHDQRMTRYGDRILTMGDGRIASIQPRPEWTTQRAAVTATAASAEPEHEDVDLEVAVAEQRPEIEPWVGGYGAVAYRPGAGPGPGAAGRPGRPGRAGRGVAGRAPGLASGGGGGLYGGRAGRASAAWQGFPSSTRTDHDRTGAPTGGGVAPPPPAARTSPPGAAGPRTGEVGGVDAGSRTEDLSGLFGPARRGRRWRRPEGGAATSESPAVRPGAGGASWGHFEDPSVSPPGGTPAVGAPGWDGTRTTGELPAAGWNGAGEVAGEAPPTGWDTTGGAAAWDDGSTGAAAGAWGTTGWETADWEATGEAAAEAWGTTGWEATGEAGAEAWGTTGEAAAAGAWGGTASAAEEVEEDSGETTLQGADERLDRSRLEDPPEAARWRYGTWPPSRSQPAARSRRVRPGPADPRTTGPIEARAVDDTGRVDPVDVARAAIHRARGQSAPPTARPATPSRQPPRTGATPPGRRPPGATGAPGAGTRGTGAAGAPRSSGAPRSAGAPRSSGAARPPRTGGRPAPGRDTAGPTPRFPATGGRAPGVGADGSRPSPWSPAAAGQLGPLPAAPGPDQPDEDPPKGRKRRRRDRR